MVKWSFVGDRVCWFCRHHQTGNRVEVELEARGRDVATPFDHLNGRLQFGHSRPENTWQLSQNYIKFVCQSPCICVRTLFASVRFEPREELNLFSSMQTNGNHLALVWKRCRADGFFYTLVLSI